VAVGGAVEGDDSLVLNLLNLDGHLAALEGWDAVGVVVVVSLHVSYELALLSERLRALCARERLHS
jgi:hypothetical protein